MTEVEGVCVTVQCLNVESVLKIEVVMPLQLTSCDSRAGGAGVTCVTFCTENTSPTTLPPQEINQT
jgi:hypothetical protein